MGLRYEAWTLPWLGDFRRKVARLHEVESTGRGQVPFLSLSGEGSVELSLAKLDRLDEIVSDTTGSLIRVFDAQPDGTNTLIDEWIAERVPRVHEENKRAVISGGNILSALDKAIIYPFDYPKNPAIQKDWIWGGGGDGEDGGMLQNSSFENTPMPNGGFEDGNTAHWETTEAVGGIFANAGLQAIRDAGDARSGEWYGLVNPSGAGGGVRRTISGLQTGSTYTITGFIQDFGATGKRWRVGVEGAAQATHTNAYQESDLWWAELGNASQGNGSSDGTYQQTTFTFVAVDQAITLYIVFQDTGPVSFNIDDWTINGDNVGLAPWTMIKLAVATVNTFEYSTEQAHSGVAALKMQGSTSAYISPFGKVGYTTMGVRQDVRMEIGKTYTGSAWVRHDGTGTGEKKFTIVFRRLTPKGPLGQTLSGNFIPVHGSYFMASRTVEVPANTWTKISMTAVADVAEVGFDVRYNANTSGNNVGTRTSPNFWIDTCFVSEGFPATTLGDILLLLLKDAAEDHANDDRGVILDWIDPTFTDTHDSNNVEWNQEISFEATMGSTYGHILDDAINLGYEITLTPKATPVGNKTHDLNAYNPDGRDDHPETAISVGQAVFGGEALNRIPSHTAVLVAAEDGAFNEATSPAAANFGRMESFLSGGRISDAATRSLMSDKWFAHEEANRHAARFQILESPDHPRPFVDYRPGDTVAMQMPPGLPKMDRRIQTISYANTQPTQYEVVGSRVMAGEAAAYDLVWRMWRRLNRPKRDPPPAAPTFGGEAGGGQFTITIAAYNASDVSKSKADLICPGGDDTGIFNMAIEAMPRTDFPLSMRGKIVLSEGDFFLRFDEFFGVISNTHLQGMGEFVTTIRGIGSYTSSSVLIDVDNAILSDVAVITPLIQEGSFDGIVVNNNNGIVRNFSHQGDAGVGIRATGLFEQQGGWQLTGTYSDAGALIEDGWGVISNIVAFGHGPAIRLHNFNAPLTLTDIAISHNSGDGPGIVFTGDGGNMTVISNFSISTPGDPCFFFDDAFPWHMVIANGFLHGSHGITGQDFWQLERSRISNLVIARPFIGGPVVKGIHLENARDVQIDNVSIHEAREHGIHIEGGVHNKVTNCHVRTAPEADDTWDGINISGDRHFVYGNKVFPGTFESNKPRHGINVESGADSVVVMNDLGPDADYASDALNDDGTDTVLAFPNHATYGDNFTL